MRNILFLLSLCSLLSIGCSSYKAFEKDESRPARNRINKQEQKGLAIAAEDYSTEKKSLKYFDRDMRDLGYLPIYIAIDNTGENEFILRTDKVEFRFEDGTHAQLAKPQEVIEEAQLSKGVALFGLIFAPFIWSSRSTANFDLDKDYNQKALRDFQIGKGDTLFGFAFVKIPKGKDETSIRDAILQMDITKKAQGKELAESLKFILAIAED